MRRQEAKREDGAASAKGAPPLLSNQEQIWLGGTLPPAYFWFLVARTKITLLHVRAFSVFGTKTRKPYLTAHLVEKSSIFLLYFNTVPLLGLRFKRPLELGASSHEPQFGAESLGFVAILILSFNVHVSNLRHVRRAFSSLTQWILKFSFAWTF
jgi:hypothetical protein